MNICLLSDRFPPFSAGGGTTYAENLARELAVKNNVTVLTMNFGAEEREEIDGVDVRRISTRHSPWTSKGFLEFQRELKARVKGSSFDAVHSCMPSLPLFLPRGSFTVAVHGTPLGELRGVLAEKALTPSSLRRILASYVAELFSVQKCRALIATSDSVKREASRAYLFPRQVNRIYYGIDSSRFKPSAVEKGFILFSGRLSGRKGISSLLRLIAETGLRFKIAGDGDERQRIEGFVREKKLGERVELLGWLSPEQMALCYQECMFTVVPSTYEPFGMVALEAFACGKPVIASSVGGLRESVGHGENGFLFAKNDFASFKKFVELLASDAALRKRLGKKALEKSRQFSWKKCAGLHEMVFRGEMVEG